MAGDKSMVTISKKLKLLPGACKKLIIFIITFIVSFLLTVISLSGLIPIL